MIKIVSFKICPFVQRVTALLEAKKIPYEIEYISLKDKPDWFLALSPTGQVPLLVTEAGSALFESDAIVEYVDEISKPLEENLTPEQRAVNRAWSYQASKHYLVQCSAMQSGNRESLEEKKKKLDSAFSKVEKKLEGGPFFGGINIGNVDIAWLPLLHRAAIIQNHSDYDFLEKFPKVKRWQAALSDTELYEKSVAVDFVDAFKGLYLSERTYLGGSGLDKALLGKESQTGGCCNS
ncbi:glutathione S-transferase [Alphaproteobacteria bacterium 46_93_T64]|nr:glutathione S-transferase [Alphaproteobacteria bacterium 46_93_T64]